MINLNVAKRNFNKSFSNKFSFYSKQYEIYDMMIIVLFRAYNFNVRLKRLNMIRSTFNSIFLMIILTIINYNAQAAVIANVGANTVYIFLLNN